ncbi:hypothetical protein BHM03_00016775 [Ensete ventricosum]|nr:hypothetical protein BHM03_00016775 [Ensete ventricosum]
MLKDDDISEHSHCWVETLPTNSATGLESHQWRSSIGYGKIIRLQHRCHIGNPGSLVLRPKPLECPLAIELATPPKNYSGGSSSSRAAFQPTDCLVDECCPWSCRNPPPKAPRSPQTRYPRPPQHLLPAKAVDEDVAVDGVGVGRCSDARDEGTAAEGGLLDELDHLRIDSVRDRLLLLLLLLPPLLSLPLRPPPPPLQILRPTSFSDEKDR